MNEGAGKGGRSNGRGLKTREAIVQAAVDVLHQTGYANFSLQQVTSRLGISLGNLTYHVPARTDLVSAMIERLLTQHRERFERFCLEYAARGSSELADLVDRLIDESIDPGKVRVFPELWAMANHDESVARAIDRLYAESVNLLMQALGLEPHAPGNAAFRSALFLVTTVAEGCTALFGRRGRHDERFLTTKLLAKSALLPLLRECLGQIRAVPA